MRKCPECGDLYIDEILLCSKCNKETTVYSMKAQVEDVFIHLPYNDVKHINDAIVEFGEKTIAIDGSNSFFYKGYTNTFTNVNLSKRFCSQRKKKYGDITVNQQVMHIDCKAEECFSPVSFGFHNTDDLSKVDKYYRSISTFYWEKKERDKKQKEADLRKQDEQSKEAEFVRQREADLQKRLALTKQNEFARQSEAKQKQLQEKKREEENTEEQLSHQETEIVEIMPNQETEFALRIHEQMNSVLESPRIQHIDKILNNFISDNAKQFLDLRLLFQIDQCLFHMFGIGKDVMSFTETDKYPEQFYSSFVNREFTFLVELLSEYIQVIDDKERFYLAFKMCNVTSVSYFALKWLKKYPEYSSLKTFNEMVLFLVQNGIKKTL